MQFRFYLRCLLLCSAQLLLSQNQQLSSEEALREFKVITERIERNFPKNEMKTFQRASFSEKQLKDYLSNHFKCLDLLSKITGHHSLKLDFYLHYGNWFREIGFPKESIKAYKRFFKYYGAHEKDLTIVEIDNYLEMQSYASGILAENYAKLGKLDSAEYEHKSNLKYTKSLRYIYYPSALNNYGLYLYWYKKELGAALEQFNQSRDILQSNFPNHTLLGSVRDNIADIYVEKGQLEDALSLYSLNFEYYKEAINEKTLQKDITRLISAGAQVVTTSLELNKIDLAENTFKKLEPIVNQNQEIYRNNKDIILNYLGAKEQLLLKQNRIEAAYLTLKQIKNYSDSLRQISDTADKKWREELNDITLDRVALNFEIERIQKENKIKSQRSRLWISGLVSSIFIIILLFLFFSRKQHLENTRKEKLLVEQKLENEALKVNQLHSEIISKKRDLSDFAINLTQNQEWAKKVFERLKLIKNSNLKERTKLLDELSEHIENKVTIDNNTKDFFERLEKLSDSFFSKLSEDHPNLSKTEIRLCSLIRLKMDSRSIATLQNITLASLNTSRYRLRKKLELSEDDDLDLFIQNI